MNNETETEREAVYQIHFDIGFESKIPAEKHGLLSTALFKSLRESKELEGWNFKYDESRHSITITQPDFEIYSWVGSAGHFDVEFYKRPTAEELESVNNVSNKVVGYVSSLSEVRVKDTNQEIIADLVISSDVLSRFIVSEALADFNSKMKSAMMPFAFVLHSTLEGQHFLVSFGRPQKKDLFHLSFVDDSKELPWDYVTKSGEKLNSLTSSVCQALGVEIVNEK